MNDQTGNNGRSVYLPRGRDQTEDLNTLADCIAASSADLFNQDGCLIWITAGGCVQVNLERLRELVPKYVATKHLRKTAGVFEVEYRPYEPDQKALHALIMAKRREDGSLLARLPKTSSAPGG
jgi:hypothetical protein